MAGAGHLPSTTSMSAARSPSSATGSTATPPSAPGGWALFQAVVALPYYWDTNPGMVRQASHAVAQVLADRSPG